MPVWQLWDTYLNKTPIPSNFSSIYIYSKLFLNIKRQYCTVSVHTNKWICIAGAGTRTWEPISFVHVADSMIATDAPHSSFPYPSRSSPIHSAPPLIVPARSPSSDNYSKSFLDCRRPFIQVTEELPVTSIYHSPDLKMIQKENNPY